MNIEERKKIDIAKAIGIILVVVGHADSPFMYYIYSFHMALFLMLSGYCYNNSHNGSVKKVGEYIVSKIKRLYIPFVIINLGFALIDVIYAFVSHNPIIKKEFVVNIIKVFCFGHYETALGHFGASIWFVRALFIISIIWCISMFLLNKINCNNSYGRIAIGLLFILVGNLLFTKGISLPGSVDSAITGVGLYGLGYELKEMKYNRLIDKSWKIAIILFVSIVGLGIISTQEITSIGANSYSSLLALLLGALFGWYAVMIFSGIIVKSRIITKVLSYIGKRTFSIMFFHIMAFKIVGSIQLIISNGTKDLTGLKEVLVYDGSHGWWIIYSIVGLGIPLLMDECYDRFKVLFGKVFLKKKQGD